MSQVRLQVRDISKNFGITKALQHVSFDVNAGEVHALIGENGSGKSTLTNMLTGIYPMETGTFILDGKEIHPLNQVDANNMGISIIVQELGTLSGLTVAENIFLGHEDRFIKHGFRNTVAMNAEANRLLQEYGFTHIKAGKMVDDYNFEDRKLIEIVKATYFHPKIVVIDETPAVGLNLRFGGGANFGGRQGRTFDPETGIQTHAHHRQVLDEMIARDKNHPCVILWSLGNEPDLEHYPESALEYWHALYEQAHAQDPQDRPVTLVCCQNDYTKDITTRTMDVVCINRYYGWYNLSGDLDAACAGLNEELDFWAGMGKPVAITEYGADTVNGLHDACGGMFSEEYQAEYYQRMGEEFDKRDFFIGEMPWNFADFATIQGPMRVGGNRKGLLTRDRRPKLAAHTLRRRWTAIPNFDYKK